MFILGKLHWVSEFAVGIFEIYMRFDEKVSYGTLFFCIFAALFAN